ncbi:MAG TPA: long-chain-fatty-acid--CoA ligase [Bryobacteraceae bacterium]|nr:long-chain-fatty-acid--CoA ligase [Bryobacteraceae bacterium]
MPLTPLRCLHRALDLFGAKTGIVSGGQEFTYAQFGDRCERLAAGLTRLGVGSGDRVAYLSYNNHQLLEGYYGVIQARAIAMPLNVRLSRGELAAILQHSGARAVLFEDEFTPLVTELRNECHVVERWISIGERVPCADLTYEELLAEGHPERADIFAYDEMSIAELFYTSGSTGVPKGVMLSHRTLYLHAMCVALHYEDKDSAVDLHTIPLFHANGWGRPHASTMLGTLQVIMRRFEPSHVFQLIQKHGATDMSLVPTMANALVHAPDRDRWNLSSMRRITVGGAANSPQLVERVEQTFPNAECFSGYGLTETSPLVTMAQNRRAAAKYGDQRAQRQAMTGAALEGVSLRVVDPEMRDVPRDLESMGEIVVLSDHVMDGYYRDPEATAAAMTGPWFHTGDMAAWDADGYVQILDRKKQIIISGGENISSIEVEAAIAAHPAVLECAVVAAPDAKWGEVPAAIVVLKPGATLTEDELLQFLQRRLAKFKLPRIFEFSAEPLPKTGTGKIRKLDLRERFWAGREKRVQG